MTDYEIDRRGDEVIISVARPVDEMLTFLKAHGIDPNRLPVPSTVTIEDGHVTFECTVRGPDGKDLIVDLDVVREKVTVDKRAPWPLDGVP